MYTYSSYTLVTTSPETNTAGRSIILSRLTSREEGPKSPPVVLNQNGEREGNQMLSYQYFHFSPLLNDRAGLLQSNGTEDSCHS